MVSFTCGDPVAAHPRLGGEDAWASHEGRAEQLFGRGHTEHEGPQLRGRTSSG